MRERIWESRVGGLGFEEGRLEAHLRVWRDFDDEGFW